MMRDKLIYYLFLIPAVYFRGWSFRLFLFSVKVSGKVYRQLFGGVVSEADAKGGVKRKSMSVMRDCWDLEEEIGGWKYE